MMSDVQASVLSYCTSSAGYVILRLINTLTVLHSDMEKNLGCIAAADQLGSIDVEVCGEVTYHQADSPAKCHSSAVKSLQLVII